MELDFKWLLGIGGVFLGYLLPKIADRWFSRKDKIDEEMLKLTLAIQALQIEIRHLTEKLSPMPKMQMDLNELHSKVRLLHKLGRDEH
jgi:hypothetical protein